MWGGWRPLGLALAVLIAAGLIAQLLDFGFGRDQAIYGVVARSVLEGGAPYRDAWDFKPPGIFFVYALASLVPGSGPHEIRVLEALALLSLWPACWLVSRRVVGSAAAGVLGATLGIAALVSLEYWSSGQPESFAGVGLLWAWALTEPAASAGRRRKALLAGWIGAGALYGLAVLLKPPLCGGILASGVALWIARDERAGQPAASGARLRPLLALALGAALPLLGCLAFFAWHEALGDLAYALFVFAPGYTALGFEVARLPGFLARALAEGLVSTAPLHLPGLAALALLPGSGPGERRAVAHAAAVVAFPLLGVAVQAKFFLYHYSAILPLCALLAAWGVLRLVRQARQRPGRAGAAVLLGVALAAVVPGPPLWPRFAERARLRAAAWMDAERRQEIRDALYSVSDIDAAETRRAARWIAGATAPDAPLFVWGFEPSLYLLSGRPPASRFIYNLPQRSPWSRVSSTRLLLRELHLTPPAAVVIASRDALPTLTGSNLDSREALAELPELRRLLEKGYRRATRIGDFEIRLRRTP